MASTAASSRLAQNRWEPVHSAGVPDSGASPEKCLGRGERSVAENPDTLANTTYVHEDKRRFESCGPPPDPAKGSVHCRWSYLPLPVTSLNERLLQFPSN